MSLTGNRITLCGGPGNFKLELSFVSYFGILSLHNNLRL